MFSVGLSGDGLKEWDLKTLSPKRNLLLTGEKGICMDYHKATETLVVGTEEGIINVFDTSDDDLQFTKLLDRQDHRIVCCKFNKTGDCLVSGSIDAVKVWSIKTGHVIHKMSTGRSDMHHETIVWCVEVLKDFTIITGDSRGRVTFWDGNLGTQIDWVQASVADVLCLAVMNDEKNFFCSGVEQIVRKYMQITTTKEHQQFDQWIRCSKRYRLHTHDIMAMTMVNDELVTSGIDGFITRSTRDLKIVERHGPFLKNPFAEITEDARLMLMHYTNYLEIWKLATASEEIEATGDGESDDENEVLKALKAKSENKFKITSFPEKFLELRSQKDEMILSASFSSNGKWIAYTTINSVRLFHFDIENSKPNLMRIKNTPEEFQPCTLLTFSNDKLFTVNLDKLNIFDFSSASIEHRQTIELENYHRDLIHKIEVSKCGKFLVLASLCSGISVWCFRKGKFVHERNLPKHKSPVTSMKIHQSDPKLYVAFSDNKICEYDLEEFLISESITSGDDPTKNAISNICLDPNNSTAIIFNQNNSINVACKADDGENEARVSKKKKKSENKNESRNVNVVKKFDNVSYN